MRQGNQASSVTTSLFQSNLCFFTLKAVSFMGGLQPRWPLVLRSLQLPHAFYTSMYSEIIAVLHYNNHDGVFHACALKSVWKSLYFIKVRNCISAIKRTLYYRHVYILVFFRVLAFPFLFTAMHVKNLALCVWEWRRYTIQYNYCFFFLLLGIFFRD